MKNKIELENKYGWICPICKTLNKVRDAECTGGAIHDLAEKSATTAVATTIAELYSWPTAAIINKSFNSSYYINENKNNLDFS